MGNILVVLAKVDICAVGKVKWSRRRPVIRDYR